MCGAGASPAFCVVLRSWQLPRVVAQQLQPFGLPRRSDDYGLLTRNHTVDAGVGLFTTDVPDMLRLVGTLGLSSPYALYAFVVDFGEE